MTDLYGASPVNRRRRSRVQLAGLDEAIITAVEEDHPVTLRGVYYRVVSAGAIPKTELGYRTIGRQLLKLRRAGVIPYSHITDGTRWLYRPTTYSTVEEALGDAAASYRKALWHDQGDIVFIFSEKDALTGVIQPITEHWDVSFGVLKGYSSETFAYNVADIMKSTAKPIYAYGLGDYDPSGVNLWESFSEKVSNFLGSQADRLVFKRLAVTPAQIQEWNLPTRPTKKSDTRSSTFKGESTEVDAIPAPRLRTLVEDTIKSHIEPSAWNRLLEVEDAERESFMAFHRAWTGVAS